MEENKDMTYEVEQDDDAIMPYGWAEGDDYFDSDSWTGGGEEASAATDTDEGTETDEEATEQSDEDDAPAIEQSEEDEVTESEEAPAEEVIPAPTKHKVKYQFDHKEVEEEIDVADLPEIMQKARSIERYKNRASQMQATAKALGYESPEELINAMVTNARNSEREALLGKGNSEEIVDDYLNRKYGSINAEAPKAEPETPAEPAPAQKTAPTFADQAKELLSEFPKLSGTRLPDEVLAASASGEKTLLQAYREYKNKQDTAETNRLRKENQILKQNAASAKRAPVSGVSKGGKTDTKPEDDFLSGFNADY